MRRMNLEFESGSFGLLSSPKDSFLYGPGQVIQYFVSLWGVIVIVNISQEICKGQAR